MSETVKPVEEMSGRELDAAVAREVMGWWSVYYDDETFTDEWSGRPGDKHAARAWVPPYSTNIAAAWEVVDELVHRFHTVVKGPFHVGSDWFAGFTPVGVTGWNGRPDHKASGSTAPLAICRAALLAVRASP